MKFFTTTLFLFLFAFLSTQAQNKSEATDYPIHEKYLKSMTWRNVGPFRGGRSCAVTGVPGKANLFYFGSTGGGVWRTTDAGNSWENISDGFFGGSIGAIAVSTKDNNVIYAGQGEETVRGNVSSGFGVWKTVDAGRTWEHIGLENTKHISRIRIHPDNPNVVLVAAMGDLFKDSEERGVFKSVDGGQTWSKVLFESPSAGAIDLIFDPVNPRILYASTWNFRRTPYSFSSGGEGCKLFKSTDGGDNWTEISTNPGFPQGLRGIIGVTVSPANPDRVWAIVENEPEGGVYRSDDAGATWKKMNQDRALRQRSWYYSRIYADTKDLQKVYVMNVSYQTSTDGGKTFKGRYAPHGDHHDLWIAPEDPDRMIIGDDGGAQITFDGGQNWSRYTNQPTAQFYRVKTDDHFPFRIYGGQQDNSSIRINHRSDGWFVTEKDWEVTAGGEAGHHAIFPDDNDLVFGGEYGGFMARYNHKTSEKQATNVWPNNPLGHGVEDMKYRFQWNYPMFFSRHNPNRLFVFSNHVHYSDDFGHSWKTISPDLTTDDKSKQGPSGGPITKDNTAVEYYCTIFAAAESSYDENVIWVGSDDGLIHVTKDMGENWENVTPKGLPEFTQINSIETDPFNEGGLYVAATRYKWGDYEPYLYYTNNFGKSWERIDEGIDRNHFTRTIRADQNKQGLLFAGTEQGVYVSADNGKKWQPFQQNLPIVPITDLAVKDRHLIAATQGRSFWICDDLSPLYELADNQADAQHLYQPKPTYLLIAGYGGKSKTAGENHPEGAIINYFLDEVDTSAHEYKMVFKAEDGTILRTFSSHAKDKKNRWLPKQGANRFIWNLRVDGVEDVKGMINWFVLNDGPRVIPGTYSVELHVDDNINTAEFSVLKDPRLASVTEQDFKDQYDFIISIRDKMNELNTAIRDIRKGRSQLNDVKGKIENESIITEIDSLVATMSGIEETLYQTKNRSPQDPLNFPIRLNNKYGHVGALASIGFNRPTEQMYGVKKELEVLINAELEKWKTLQTEFTALNQKLREESIPYIKL